MRFKDVLNELLAEDDFLGDKSYCVPYSQNDIKDAIKFGKLFILQKMRDKIRGQVINGICIGVVTESDLLEIEKELEE